MDTFQQVCCTSPPPLPFCKIEPESPTSTTLWTDTAVDFTESNKNFGEYWPATTTINDWNDEFDADDVDNDDKDDIKKFITSADAGCHDDVLFDLDLLMKEEPFTWVDDRNDSLYTPSYDWSTNDGKLLNNSPTSTSSIGSTNLSSIDDKSVNNILIATTQLVANNNQNNNNHNTSSASNLLKIYQTQQHLVGLNASTTATTGVNTPDLLREFEDVLISTTTGSLTPPESPRDQAATSLITLLQDIEPCSASSNEIDQIVASQAENMVSTTHNIQQQQHHLHQNDIEQQQLHLQQPQHPISSPLSSPDPWSSPSVNGSSSSSSSGNSSDSGYDDPDWSPNSPIQIDDTFGYNNNNLDDNGSNKRSSTSAITTNTRRKRAAATTTEERKLRKKEQNKNAATRYRQKKKQEIEVIIGEERGLLEKHERLKADATEITREIRYLKSLLRDLYKAKGLISA